MPQIRLNDSEWRIMLLLWEKPMTMPELHAALQEETLWSRHTVISFLNRLINKGAITVQEAKPARIYSALIEREASMLEETKSFLGRLYNGKAGLLVASLVQQEELGAEEIEELMRLLETAQGRERDERVSE